MKLNRNQTRLLILNESKLPTQEKHDLLDRMLFEDIDLINRYYQKKGYERQLINENIFEKIFGFIEDLGLSDRFGERFSQASSGAFKQSIARRIIMAIAPGFSESFAGSWSENIAEQLTAENIAGLMGDGSSRCEVVTSIVFDGLVEALGEDFILDAIFGVNYEYDTGFIRGSIAKIVREMLADTLKNVEGLQDLKQAISDKVCSLDLGGFGLLKKKEEDEEEL